MGPEQTLELLFLVLPMGKFKREHRVYVHCSQHRAFQKDRVLTHQIQEATKGLYIRQPRSMLGEESSSILEQDSTNSSQAGALNTNSSSHAEATNSNPPSQVEALDKGNPQAGILGHSPQVGISSHVGTPELNWEEWKDTHEVDSNANSNALKDLSSITNKLRKTEPVRSTAHVARPRTG